MLSTFPVPNPVVAKDPDAMYDDELNDVFVNEFDTMIPPHPPFPYPLIPYPGDERESFACVLIVFVANDIPTGNDPTRPVFPIAFNSDKNQLVPFVQAPVGLFAPIDALVPIAVFFAVATTEVFVPDPNTVLVMFGIIVPPPCAATRLEYLILLRSRFTADVCT